MSTRILCVHDGEDELQQLRGTLEEAGYEVVSALTGHEALHILRSVNVQGVVLDYDATAPGGVSLRNRIQHVCPDLPLLMISSVDDVPIGALRHYLDNPASPEALCSLN
ncbi:MAG TPA: response regulator [Terriglobales bacterium]|nr:response regulator [Terriglobales bacterium]